MHPFVPLLSLALISGSLLVVINNTANAGIGFGGRWKVKVKRSRWCKTVEVLFKCLERIDSGRVFAIVYVGRGAGLVVVPGSLRYWDSCLLRWP